MHSDLCPLDRPLDFLVGRDLSLPLFWHIDTDQDAATEIPPPTSVPSGWLVLGVVPQLGHVSVQELGKFTAFWISESQATVMQHSYSVHVVIKELHLEQVKSFLDLLEDLDLLDDRRLSLCEH